ncbi:MAG: PhzF family phenazine biosynthesis protein [Acidobacteria bacterium]|nr:PhzF family phenazine biosynthesis protein [Acidobacteriota bacterium]
MRAPLFQVDAFADRPFSGNPAAVCLLDEPAAEAWMQSVAAEMNLAETAFVVAGEPFGLRWFTPTVEVELCGHATLASAHVLWSEGRVPAGRPIEFSTRSGLLRAHTAGGLIELDLPAAVLDDRGITDGVSTALGVAAVATGHTTNGWALVEVATVEEVAQARPDLGAAALAAEPVILTASDGEDVACRVFGPGVGIDEDPVTGSAQCVLAPWWHDRLGDRFVTRQLSARGGTLHVRLDGDRVRVGGHAVTVLRGELTA